MERVLKIFLFIGFAIAIVGCVRELPREGGNHSVYVNRAARKVSSVPRHREINEHLARKICRDLDVPRP